MNQKVQIILVLLGISMVSASSDDDFCKDPKIKETIEDIRSHMKYLDSYSTKTDADLKQIEESFKVFVNKYRKLIEVCGSEDNQHTDIAGEFFENINDINQCVMSIMRGDLEMAKKALERVNDKQLIELMVTIYCSNVTDCSMMVKLAHNLKNINATIYMYKSMSHLLENNRMNSSMAFIGNLFEAKEHDHQNNVTEVLVGLLKRAIKSELKYNFPEIQTLYTIDSALIYEIVQELINDLIDNEFETYEIFQLAQRSPNVMIWLKLLQAILHKLEARQEISSVLGAELAREIKNIEKIQPHMNETELKILSELKQATPLFVKKLLQGEICCDMNIFDNISKPEETQVYTSAKFDGVYQRVKLIPEVGGPLAMIKVIIEDANMTLILDNFDHGGQILWNNVTVPVTDAKMEPLPLDEFCQMEKQIQRICAPSELILSTITNSPFINVGEFEKFYMNYHSNKDPCPKQ